MKLPRFTLKTEAKDKILAQFTNESEKKSIAEVLSVVESAFNQRQLVIAKKLNESSKLHFKNLYGNRAKVYLAKQESVINLKAENVAKLTAKTWLKENRVALVSQIKQAKAERIENLMEAMVSKFFVGVPAVTKKLVEGYKRVNKQLKNENETIHLALAERNKDASKKIKMKAYESSLVGLTSTQKEKLTSLVKALPKMTSEKFVSQLKNIRSLVASNSQPVKKNESIPKVESENTIYRTLFRS